MTKEIRDAYLIGEADFYCGVSLSNCPYDSSDDSERYEAWQEGWRDSFICYVNDEDEDTKELYHGEEIPY